MLNLRSLPPELRAHVEAIAGDLIEYRNAVLEEAAQAACNEDAAAKIRAIKRERGE